jgi:hypothetical protein
VTEWPCVRVPAVAQPRHPCRTPSSERVGAVGPASSPTDAPGPRCLPQQAHPVDTARRIAEPGWMNGHRPACGGRREEGWLPSGPPSNVAQRGPTRGTVLPFTRRYPSTPLTFSSFRPFDGSSRGQTPLEEAVLGDQALQLGSLVRRERAPGQNVVEVPCRDSTGLVLELRPEVRRAPGVRRGAGASVGLAPKEVAPQLPRTRRTSPQTDATSRRWASERPKTS